MSNNEQDSNVDQKQTTSSSHENVNDNSNIGRVYHPPLWSAKPSNPVKLQIIKEGVIVDHIDISEKPYYILGRLVEAVDIPMHHPSISRTHAVLQHRNNGTLYIYDLGSTHGTFWNRRQIKSHTHVPVRPGDSVSLGASTRFITLEEKAMPAQPGLEEELNSRKTSKQKTMKKNSKNTDNNNKNERNEEGEEDDDENEDEEAGYGSEEEKRDMRLRIEDGAPTMADLDVMDEDDEFFDRTERMNKYTPSKSISTTGRKKKKSDNEVETLDSLRAKRDNVEDEMEKLRVRIRKVKRESEVRADLANLEREQLAEGEEEDSMDAYMRQLSASQDQDTVHSLEQRLDRLDQERAKLERLIKIATPAIGADNTTGIAAPVDVSEDMFIEDEQKNQRKETQKQKEKNITTKLDNEVSNDDSRSSETETEQGLDKKVKKCSKKEKKENDFIETENSSSTSALGSDEQGKNKEREKTSTPIPDTSGSQQSTETESEKQPEFKTPSAPPPRKRRREKQPQDNVPRKKAKVAQWWEVDESNEEWVPPSDQTGDGRTSLNDKLGY